MFSHIYAATYSAELKQATANIRYVTKRFYIRECRNPVAVTAGSLVRTTETVNKVG
jgi:hypothetical protein